MITSEILIALGLIRNKYLGIPVYKAVKVLCYKSEGRWFDPSWCIWLFHWHKILPIALWSWGRLSLWQEWVPGVFPGGKEGRCVRLKTYHRPVPLSRNLGTLTSWKPLGLFRPVMRLLYIYLYRYIRHAVWSWSLWRMFKVCFVEYHPVYSFSQKMKHL